MSKLSVALEESDYTSSSDEDESRQESVVQDDANSNIDLYLVYSIPPSNF